MSGAVEHSRSRLEDGPALDRVTYRETEANLEAIDALVDAGEFPNRSEAIRAATRQFLAERDGDSE